MKLRRYANRTLFEPGGRRWVKISHVMRALRQGEDLEVVDAKTGKDVTALVLTQVIYELAMCNRPLPAAPLLAYAREYVHFPKSDAARELEKAIIEEHMATYRRK